MQHSSEDKKRFVEEWVASKLSRRKYADEIGVGYGTFVNWCKKYSESAASEIEGQGFVEVNKKIAPEQKRGIIIELGAIKIHLPVGVTSSEIKTVLDAAR
jgi:transposase